MTSLFLYYSQDDQVPAMVIVAAPALVLSDFVGVSYSWNVTNCIWKTPIRLYERIVGKVVNVLACNVDFVDAASPRVAIS
jgi:hypothetical protein